MVPQHILLEIEMALVTQVLNVHLSVELQVAIVLLGINNLICKLSIFGHLIDKKTLNFIVFQIWSMLSFYL